MTLTIELTPEIEARLKNRAVANGYNEITDYAKKVLEDDTNKMKTLDEIFAPFREHTEQISEEEIDDLVKKARREVFAEKKAKQEA
jgi:type III secretory pathway component EscR